MTNRQKIKRSTDKLLGEAVSHMKRKIVKALQSGVLDTEGWNEDVNGMILPKIILIAILENEANQYKAEGTSFEKEVKKEVANLKLFL